MGLRLRAGVNNFSNQCRRTVPRLLPKFGTRAELRQLLLLTQRSRRDSDPRIVEERHIGTFTRSIGWRDRTEDTATVGRDSGYLPRVTHESAALQYLLRRYGERFELANTDPAPASESMTSPQRRVGDPSRHLVPIKRAARRRRLTDSTVSSAVNATA
jgi:hypothetical protein